VAILWSLTQVFLASVHNVDQYLELLIYYSDVHSPTVAVEMGMPGTKPGILYSLFVVTSYVVCHCLGNAFKLFSLFFPSILDQVKQITMKY
jgi:hypothetical protein